MLKQLLFTMLLTAPVCLHAQKQIAITAPVNAAVWHIGNTYTITWTVATGAPDTMMFFLTYDSGGVAISGTLVDKVPTKTKSISVKIPQGLIESSLYTLQAVTADGNEDALSDHVKITIAGPTGNNGIAEKLPNAFISSLNYHKGVLNVNYTLPQASMVNMSIYDLSGKKIAVSDSRFDPQGENNQTLNPGNIPFGIYICKLQIGNTLISRIFTVR